MIVHNYDTEAIRRLLQQQHDSLTAMLTRQPHIHHQPADRSITGLRKEMNADIKKAFYKKWGI